MRPIEILDTSEGTIRVNISFQFLPFGSYRYKETISFPVQEKKVVSPEQLEFHAPKTTSLTSSRIILVNPRP